MTFKVIAAGKMNRLALLLAGVAIAGAAGPAAAQTAVYVTAFGGSDSPGRETLDGANSSGAARHIEATLDDGSIFGAALGVTSPDYSFGRFRAEVEVSSRKSDLQGIELNGVARTIRDDGNVSVSTGMVQALYDTPLYWDRVRFHVGAGYGFAAVDHNLGYLVANAAAIGSSPGNFLINIPNAETTSAYQVMAGAEFVLTPTWSLTADVRSLRVGDLQAQRFIENSIINGTPTTTGTLDSVLSADYSSTSYTVGLKYAF